MLTKVEPRKRLSRKCLLVRFIHILIGAGGSMIASSAHAAAVKRGERTDSGRMQQASLAKKLTFSIYSKL
jgi:hypothetical protein